MSGRRPKFSKVDPEDAQKEYDKEPFKKLSEKPGIKIKSWTRRRGR